MILGQFQVLHPFFQFDLCSNYLGPADLEKNLLQ